MRYLAALCLATGWCWNRFVALDPTRGLPMASKAQRDFLDGKWS